MRDFGAGIEIGVDVELYSSCLGRGIQKWIGNFHVHSPKFVLLENEAILSHDAHTHNMYMSIYIYIYMERPKIVEVGVGAVAEPGVVLWFYFGLLCLTLVRSGLLRVCDMQQNTTW